MMVRDAAFALINRLLGFHEGIQEYSYTICRNRGPKLHSDRCPVWQLHAALDIQAMDSISDGNKPPSGLREDPVAPRTVTAPHAHDSSADLSSTRARPPREEPTHDGHCVCDECRAIDAEQLATPSSAGTVPSSPLHSDGDLRAFAAFADRLWHRWQAEKLRTGSDHKAYHDAVANELKDMQPLNGTR